MDGKPKLLLLITEDWYFWSHRRAIATAAQAAGFEVLIASRFHEHEAAIRQAGFTPVPIRLRRSGRNPFRELSAILDLIRIYRKHRPSIVHHVAIKPVLYGSWAAAIAGVPAVVNALAGLGHVFIAKGIKASFCRNLATFAYRSALRLGRSRLIFQNSEDQNMFAASRIIDKEKTVLIKGAGVDLDEFSYRPEPEDNIPTVMLAGRLLWSKGIGELVEAARILKQKGVQHRLVLVGVTDQDNPEGIPEQTIREWEQEGTVEWWGRRNDMPEVLAKANLVVLPSYREGAPKVLIEAAAVGRAIVATDVVGCREIVRHNENGLLVPSHDPQSLAEAIETLLRAPEVRDRMGRRGRQIVAAEFSEERVVEATLDLYRQLLGDSFPQEEPARAAA